MTVPTYQVPDSAPTRPLTVTFSSILLFVVAGAQLLSAATVLSIMGPLAEAYEGMAEADELGADLNSIISFALVGTAIVYALIAIVLAVLAVFNNMGKNGSRVTTWVFGGLGLCCNSVGLGGTAAGSLAGGAGSGGMSQEQLDAELAGSLPGWYEPVGTAISVVIVLSLIGALILLALPASNAWFRRPAAWNPAMPYPQYPGQPGYPVQPGYPAQPGYPGYPGHPAQPGYPGPYGQPAYPPAQPSPHPGQTSHFGTPEQYGRPGEPAPGLPSYPGPAGTHAPGTSPEPTSDPWAPQPGPTSTPPVSSGPPAPASPAPTSDPWASPQEPFPAGPSPFAPPAVPSAPEPASDPWAAPSPPADPPPAAPSADPPPAAPH